MSYRSEDLHFATDRGMPIQDARCEAFRMDTKASVEEAFTDEYGDVAFTLLPAAIDCIIFCYHHGTSSFYYSKKDPPLGDLDGDLDDIDDGASYGKVELDQLTVNRITLGGADGDLDDITDGTYGKVLSTHIDEGKIQISSSTTYATNYDPSSKKKVFTATPTTPYYVGDLWVDDSNIRRCITQRVTGSYTSDDWIQTTLDAIKDGTTYQRVKSTSISAGNIKLTSNTVVDGEWYNLTGVLMDATKGIRLYGTDMAFGTFANVTDARAGTNWQTKMGSDGKIYAGAGNVYMDSTGMHVKGTSAFIARDTDGTARGYIGGYKLGTYMYIHSPSGSDIFIEGGAGTGKITLRGATLEMDGALTQGGGIINRLDYIEPYTTNSYDLGKIGGYWRNTVTKLLTLYETTTPTANADYGKLYTKSDNKLYFQDGAGTEYTVDLTAV